MKYQGGCTPQDKRGQGYLKPKARMTYEFLYKIEHILGSVVLLKKRSTRSYRALMTVAAALTGAATDERDRRPGSGVGRSWVIVKLFSPLCAGYFARRRGSISLPIIAPSTTSPPSSV